MLRQGPQKSEALLQRSQAWATRWSSERVMPWLPVHAGIIGGSEGGRSDPWTSSLHMSTPATGRGPRPPVGRWGRRGRQGAPDPGGKSPGRTTSGRPAPVPAVSSRDRPLQPGRHCQTAVPAPQGYRQQNQKGLAVSRCPHRKDRPERPPPCDSKVNPVLTVNTSPGGRWCPRARYPAARPSVGQGPEVNDARIQRRKGA